MEERKNLVAGLVFVFVLFSVGVIYWLSLMDNSTRPVQKKNVVSNFEECVAAGYPVMESYPRQCSDGTQTFEEKVIMPEPYPLETKPGAAADLIEREQDGCVITGCNGEVCVSEEVSQVMGITPCIYKPEFACYEVAICGKDASGECAWQETSEFAACIEDVRTETGSAKEVPFELGGACTDRAQCAPGSICILDGDASSSGHCINRENVSGCVMLLVGGEVTRECTEETDTGEILDPPVR